MTVLSPAQIVGTALPSFAPAPISSGPAGAGLGARIDVDWQGASRAKEIKKRADRRAAIAKARKVVEGRTETKAERLARQQGAARLTGSEAERRETRGSVAKAAAALADVPMDKEFSAEEYRMLREKLRQRYPGKSLSSMLTQAATMEQMLLDDPVQAREALHAAYSRAQYAPTYVEPKYASGLRGSLQRARLEQQDGEDLKDWIAKYGRRLPQILAELEALDRHLTADPAMASAKVAARFGAPVIESEIAPYMAKQGAKAEKAQLQAVFDNRCRGIQLAIEHGHIPGGEENLEEIAAVLQDPKFQHHPTDAFETLKRAAAIIQHPDHKWLTGKRKAAPKRDPGQLSIGGGSPNTPRDREKGTGGVRASIARVRGAM